MASFVDRVPQRALMGQHFKASLEAEAPCRFYIHGIEQSGRWSLASQFFHENVEDFKRNYVEVLARQADGLPVPVGDMLAQALIGLGAQERELPTSDHARAHELQRRSVAQTYLMVIRDVVSAEQVRLLVPTSPGVTVVVTARANLWDLQATYDFRPVPLDELPPDAALQLMAERLGEAVTTVEPDILQKLVALCEGHPLVIRRLAARLSAHPDLAQRIVGDAENSSVGVLELDESKWLADHVYDALDDELRRAYRLLVLIPGPDFGAGAAAVVLDADERLAAKLIDKLVDGNMLRTAGSGRYAYFRLLRSDAASRIEDRDDRAAVVTRVTEWYLSELDPRDGALANRWRVGATSESVPVSVDRGEALAWFRAEQASVLACVASAADNGQHEVAVRLCLGLYKYAHHQGRLDLWLDCLQAGLRSAELTGNTAAIMQLESHRGAAHLAKEEFEAARASFLQSLKCAREIGHAMGEQSALEWLGKVATAEAKVAMAEENFEVATTKIDEAFRYYDDSEKVVQLAGEMMPADQPPRMIALLGLQRARTAAIVPDHVASARWAGGALSFFDLSTEVENRAKCLMVLGAATSNLPAGDDPVECFEKAAGLFAEDGLRRGEAEARFHLGLGLSGRGQADDALVAYQRAHELYTELGAAEADEVLRAIESLGL
ncbi:NB-ARC domain-containing protein [Kribbella sp. NBC_01505]|uniref:NB-ARC domain-containing protein n=1 Tax=Kribbella sp. NBC_01505 TaxID=2903580 RepID=UPI003868D1C8